MSQSVTSLSGPQVLRRHDGRFFNVFRESEAGSEDRRPEGSGTSVPSLLLPAAVSGGAHTAAKQVENTHNMYEISVSIGSTVADCV